MKNLNYFSIFLLFIAVAFVGVWYSCNSGNNTPQKEDTTINKDSTQVDTTQTSEVQLQNETQPAQPTSAVFIFDSSVSMKGYLDCYNDSRFRGVTTYFINQSKNEPSIYLYGKTEGNLITKSNFDSKLNTRNISWSDESNLKDMIGSMVKHIEHGEDISLLLTDGILSGSNAEIRNSPNRSYNIISRESMEHELTNLLENEQGKLCALIVRYMAKFNGKYSCFNNDSKTLNNQERPFYIIALGKWEYIKYLEQELNDLTNNAPQPEDIVMIGDARSYEKIKLSAAKGLNTKGGKLRIKNEFKNESIQLSADLKDLPSYMRNENYMNSNIELYITHKHQQEKRLDKNSYEISIDSDNQKNILRLDINSHALKNSKLTFKLKYELPQWVEEKSDENDLDIKTNPTKLGKTFNLKYFTNGFKILHKGKYIKEQSLEFE